MRKLTTLLFTFAAFAPLAMGQLIYPPPYPRVAATYDATAQAASIGSTTLYTAPADGMYRMSAYLVVTQAATTSSTLPNVFPSWTDADTGVTPGTNAITATQTGNTVGATNSQLTDGAAGRVFRAKSGTAIRFNASNYASSGATPMQYAIHVRLEHLGP